MSRLIDLPEVQRPDATASSRYRHLPVLWIFGALQLLLLGIALFFRMWHLDNIPGVNGDEAWTAIQGRLLVRGMDLEWITNTGRVIDPFFILPFALLDRLGPLGFLHIRLVAVVSSLLGLLANYCLCRRTFDRRTALISTTVLAVLPTLLIESRIGWENSQILPAGTLVLYPALLIVTERNRSWYWCLVSCLALGASLLVHYVMIFAAPVIGAAALVRWHMPIRSKLRDGIKSGAGRVAGSILLLVLLLGSAGTLLIVSDHLAAPLRDLFSVRYAANFLVRFTRIFSGVETFRYYAGSCFPPLPDGGLLPLNLLWRDAVALGGLGICGTGFLMRLKGWRHADSRDLALAGGLSAGIAAFYLLGGVAALAAPSQRFALPLLLPACLIAVRGWEALVDRVSVKARLSWTGIGLGLLFLLPGSVYRDFFQYIRATGGTSARTFHTGSTEPKLSAWNLIRARSADSPDPVWILSSEFWNYQPLRFLTMNEPRVRTAWFYARPGHLRVLKSDAADAASPAILAAVRDGSVYFVEFADSPGYYGAVDLLNREKVPFSTEHIRGYSANPVVAVICPLQSLSEVRGGSTLSPEGEI